MTAVLALNAHLIAAQRHVADDANATAIRGAWVLALSVRQLMRTGHLARAVELALDADNLVTKASNNPRVSARTILAVVRITGAVSSEAIAQSRETRERAI